MNQHLEHLAKDNDTHLKGLAATRRSARSHCRDSDHTTMVRVRQTQSSKTSASTQQTVSDNPLSIVLTQRPWNIPTFPAGSHLYASILVNGKTHLDLPIQWPLAINKRIAADEHTSHAR